MNISKIWNDFIDLIFPRVCEACDEALIGNESVICTQCRITLPRVEQDSIRKDELLQRFSFIPEVKCTYAYLVFSKKGRVQKLLHALKYKNRPEVGIVLGEMLGQELIIANNIPPVELIVSVPLHPKKVKKRGYNQSDKIAEGLSNIIQIPWSGRILSRNKNTDSQTGKSKFERRENMAGIFEMGEPLNQKQVILIDDVLTTGATLEACMNKLKENGCTAFYIFTIASA